MTPTDPCVLCGATDHDAVACPGFRNLESTPSNPSFPSDHFRVVAVGGEVREASFDAIAICPLCKAEVAVSGDVPEGASGQQRVAWVEFPRGGAVVVLLGETEMGRAEHRCEDT